MRRFSLLVLVAGFAAPAFAQPVAAPPTAEATPVEAPLPSPERAPEAPQVPVERPLAAAPATPPAPAAAAAAAPWTVHIGEATLKLELQVRTRGEARANPYYGPFALTDTHFVTARFRVGATAQWRFLRVRLQAQEARDLGAVAPGTEAGNYFGVHQGYAELFREHAFLRIGRQEVAYGDERLVGPLDWASAARSFDAIRGHSVVGDFSFDAFAAIVTSQQRLLLPTAPVTYARTGGDYFAAAQVAYAPVAAFHTELLYLYRHDRATVATPTNDRRISALSLRTTGEVGTHFRYVTEGIFEFGADQRKQFLAYAALADVFALLPGPNPTSIGAGAALGSGDRAGRVGEFENFYPTNHKFYGFADLFGLRNVIEGHAVVTQQLAQRKVQLLLQGYAFFLEQTGARWTNAGGALVAAGNAANNDRFAGWEVDTTTSYRANEMITVSGGYSLFVQGAAANTLIPANHRAQHWAYVMLDFHTN